MKSIIFPTQNLWNEVDISAVNSYILHIVFFFLFVFIKNSTDKRFFVYLYTLFLHI